MRERPLSVGKARGLGTSDLSTSTRGSEETSVSTWQRPGSEPP